MIKITEHVSRHLRLLTAIATIFVVFIHATTLKNDDTLGWDSFVGQIQGLFSHHICHVALPIFFLNSAFFLFLNVEKIGDVFIRVKKRSVTLLMPYLAWSGLWIIICVYLGIFPYLAWPNLISTWLWHPLIGQFWFLRDLIFLVVLAPIIFLLPTRILVILCITTWVWWVLGQTVGSLDLRSKWYELISNEALSWFLIGVLGARFAKVVVKKIQHGFHASFLLGMFGFWILGSLVPLPMQIADGLSVTAGTLFLLGTAPYLKNISASKWTSAFASYSFVIYAGHHPAISILQEKLIQDTSGYQFWHLFVYLLTPLMIMLFVTFSFSILSRIFPRIVYIANGGRYLPRLFSKSKVRDSP